MCQTTYVEVTRLTTKLSEKIKQEEMGLKYGHR